MKINGSNSKPIELAAVKAQKNKEVLAESPKPTETDVVEAKLSQTLSSLEKAIQESGLTPYEVHSKVDEKRLQGLLDSLDRVESKRPRLADEQVLAIANKVAGFFEDDPKKASALFKPIDPERVADLLA